MSNFNARVTELFGELLFCTVFIHLEFFLEFFVMLLEFSTDSCQKSGINIKTFLFECCIGIIKFLLTMAEQNRYTSIWYGFKKCISLKPVRKFLKIFLKSPGFSKL